MSAQYDDLESAIESSYKKLTADQRGEIEELNAQIAAVNEQIRKLRAAQEKIKEVAAALESLEERQAAANLSKKITTLEAKAQRIKASLMTRTPVPTTKTPTRKG
jgi:hypothetical protein